MKPLVFSVRGIGLVGPGMASWAEGAALLRAPQSLPAGVATVVPAPERLPAAERRRAGSIVKLSIAAADAAVRDAGVDAGTLPTVFTSSSGDVANCHALCEALALPERFVSPTRFTNSVHNAPAGYWHIATQARAASTSLCGFDASFGAGLLEAAAQCIDAGRPVLLVAADCPYPEPLHAKRPLADAFGVAFVLAPGAQEGGTTLTLRTTADAPTRCGDALALEALRAGIPAARCLPLLQRLAHAAPARVVVEHFDGLNLEVCVA